MVQGGAGIQGVSHSLSKAIVGQFTVTLSTYIFGKDVPTQPINPDSPFELKSLQHLFVGIAVSAVPIIFMAFLVTVRLRSTLA